jgi:hypothetical protein
MCCNLLLLAALLNTGYKNKTLRQRIWDKVRGAIRNMLGEHIGNLINRYGEPMENLMGT